MSQRPPHLTRSRQTPLLVLPIGGIALIGLLLAGIGAWVVIVSSQPPNAAQKNIKNAGITVVTKGNTVPGNTAVSPLIFGTNLGLFDAKDQILNSSSSRAALQQMHMRIIRMPTRYSLSEATQIQAAQDIKSLGATPLVILHNMPNTPTALSSNLKTVQDITAIFGNSTVYYEFGNEADLNGISAERYTTAWNAIVPQLKRVAPQGQFIGPVNYHYDGTYLSYFLRNAQPRADAISWHEYTCDDGWDKAICIAHIANWTNHITNARTVMNDQLGTQLPIMITEWNYAPNAVPNDGKNNDANFMATWTSTALQTLAANRVFASMQYSCTNTAIPLIDGGNAITTQGNAFRTQYEQMITNGKQPAPVAGAGQNASSTPTAIALTGTQFSFEDGGTANWNGHGQGISNVQNSTTVALDGTHSLQATLANASSRDFPYLSTDLTHQATQPHTGQTLTAYVYLASNAVSVNAKLFTIGNNYRWSTGNTTPLTPGTWTKLTYTISSTPRGIGIQFNSSTGGNISCSVYIDAIGWQ